MLFLLKLKILQICCTKPISREESHSAKEANQRPIFNEIIEEIKQGKYNGILTWAPDRISRNAGDLGRIVDSRLIAPFSNLKLNPYKIRVVWKNEPKLLH